MDDKVVSEMPVWGDEIPGAIADAGEERCDVRAGGERWVENVDAPILYRYPALPDRKTGAAVVICPGGGYGGLAIDKEGHDVAGWFNCLGVDAFVLKYRAAPYRHPIPLMDAQQAMRIVRSRADEWELDHDRIGIMGFSAGGHLATTVMTHADRPARTEGDLGDVPCHASFAVLGYPVVSFVDYDTAHQGSRGNLLGPDASEDLWRELSAEENVTPGTPPAFFFHAENDQGVRIGNSIALRDALKDRGIASELFALETGGHGFGPHRTEWFGPLAKWLAGVGVVPVERLEEDIEVSGDGLELAVIIKGVRACRDRDYAFGDIPVGLLGWYFTRVDEASGSAITAEVLKDTIVCAGVVSSQDVGDFEGWRRDATMDFSCTDEGETPVRVLSREVYAGDRVMLPQVGEATSVLIAPSLRIAGE